MYESITYRSYWDTSTAVHNETFLFVLSLIHMRTLSFFFIVSKARRSI